jgi:hypothetical protein
VSLSPVPLKDRWTINVEVAHVVPAFASSSHVIVHFLHWSHRICNFSAHVRDCRRVVHFERRSFPASANVSTVARRRTVTEPAINRQVFFLRSTLFLVMLLVLQGTQSLCPHWRQEAYCRASCLICGVPFLVWKDDPADCCY